MKPKTHKTTILPKTKKKAITPSIIKSIKSSINKLIALIRKIVK